VGPDDLNKEPDERSTKEFSPAFTYPIFGEEEQIFGYKGLHVQVFITFFFLFNNKINVVPFILISVSFNKY